MAHYCLRLGKNCHDAGPGGAACLPCLDYAAGLIETTREARGRLAELDQRTEERWDREDD